MISDFRDASEFEPMSKEMSMLFADACVRELSSEKIPFLDEALAKSMGFSAQVLERRLAVMSPETRISAGVGAVLAYHCRGNPGRAVLWAFTLHRMAIDCGGDILITMTELAETFPMGFPTDKAFAELWDGQKSSAAQSDNLLDVKEIWVAA